VAARHAAAGLAAGIPAARGAPTSTARLLEISSLLHSAESLPVFFALLETAFPELAGHGGFTWVSIRGGEGTVLYSTEIPGLEERFTPPVIDSRRLAELLGRSYGTFGGERAIRTEVEGRPLSVADVWRLPGDSGGLILLHSRLSDRQAPETDLHRALLAALGRAWQRLRRFAEMEARLEHSEAKLGAIGEIGEMLGSLEVDVLLTKLMELSLYVVKGQVGSIILTDEDGSATCPVEWGLPLSTAACFRDTAGRVIHERVGESGEAFRHARGEGGEAIEVVGAEVWVDSLLCIPLTSASRTLGTIIIVNSTEADGFTQLDTEVLLAISGLAATSLENAMLHRDSLEKERLRQSLAIARDIQQRLYPSVPPPLGPGVQVAWRTEPCDETGGDYLDFVETPTGVALVVGDVSGHGIGAALLMAAARAGLRTALARGVPAAEAMASLNDELERDTEPDQFMTLLVLAWSPGAPAIEYVNAGHDTPSVYRRKSGRIESLASTGIPLGLFPGATYGTKSFESLATGDALLLTTDGVWEVADPEGRMLGKPVLIELFRGFAAYPADRIASEVLRAVGDYTHSAPPRDDRTIVVVRAV